MVDTTPELGCSNRNIGVVSSLMSILLEIIGSSSPQEESDMPIKMQHIKEMDKNNTFFIFRRLIVNNGQIYTFFVL